MTTRLFILLLLVGISVRTIAQAPARCVFSGIIFQADKVTPVANAQIYLSGYAPVRGLMDANWTSAFTDSAGNFRIDVKGAPKHARIVRLEGDTIDLEVEGIQCNTQQNIILALPESEKLNDFGYQLPEVLLEAYGARETDNGMPAPIGFIDKRLLGANDQTSLQNVMNTVPGVVMESRGYGGSHRLSIRGSSLRSPFAVRNVKLYLDGMPLTGADGQTPLELVDAAEISSIEIIKGPAGSMYGSGNGGVLLVKSVPVDSGAVRIQSNFQLASYEGYRSNTSVAAGFKSSELRISNTWQDYAGYRDQEYNRKQQVTMSLKQHINTKQTLTLWGSYYNGSWGLPGALNSAQADTMPTQAVPFSLLNNASLTRERWLGAISQEGSWGKYGTHHITLNYHQTQKTNPYGTSAFNSGFKNEQSKAITGRAQTGYDRHFNAIRLQAIVGAEWQKEHYTILEQTISNAQPEDFKYYYDIDYQQSLLFGQTILKWKDVLTIQSGLSVGDNEQVVRGRNKDEFSFDTTTTWGNTVLPRVAVSLELIEGLHLFRSYSTGVANPTVFEIIDQENNTYNRNLTSEQGTLNELGIKHQLVHGRFNYSVNVYRFEITDAILPYSKSDNFGESIQLYHNDGSTMQSGLEWTLHWRTNKSSDFFSLELWNTGSINNHRFDDYVSNGTILNENRLPGVPLSQMNSGVNVQYKAFAISIIDYWMDRMPLNNTNTQWSNPYHLMNVMATWDLKLWGNLDCRLHAGVNNLFNSNYSSFLNLNAAASKFYNPSAPRNTFFGVRINYTIPMK